MMHVNPRPIVQGSVLRVDVTAEDIEESVRNFYSNSRDCPIENALQRISGKKWSVSQSDAACPRLKVTFILPAEAQRFVHEYDRDMQVKPFSFVVTVDNRKMETFRVEYEFGVALRAVLDAMLSKKGATNADVHA